jgi:methylisocitrate lyase
LNESAGARFRQAIEEENPLQVVGAINAYCAKLAERAGFRAIYLSGAGVANASHGLPDLGTTTLSDVLEDARRIISATNLPLLVDCDTGWGSSLTIARTVREMIGAGVAAIHFEDQSDSKRCGHRPGKQLVSCAAMVERLQAATDARTDRDFIIMARTDAVAVEGLDAAIERSLKYVEVGADMIFAEALTDVEQFQHFTQSVSVPVLANMTEWGKSPLLTVEELRQVGVRIALYPLTAFRAMSLAAQRTYEGLRNSGTQREILDTMQTREELYDVLDYYRLERELDVKQASESVSRVEDQL